MITPTQPILGGPSVPFSVLLRALNRYDTAWVLPFVECDAIAAAYVTMGELSGIGSLMPFAQAAHETAWFSSEWWRIKRNPAGIGVTGQPGVGCSFPNIAAGVAAQYGHLLEYASSGQLSGPRLGLSLWSPRRLPVALRGSAPRWRDLEGRWAVPGHGYAEAICAIANSIASA